MIDIKINMINDNINININITNNNINMNISASISALGGTPDLGDKLRDSAFPRSEAE